MLPSGRRNDDERPTIQGNEVVMSDFFRWRSVVGFLAMAFAMTASLSSSAEQSKKLPTNPVGAGWDSKVKAAENGPASRVLSSDQMSTIAKVNAFFNALTTLQGRFTQTNPDTKTQRGTFYLMRPGRFRFDYNRPSRQIIVSDGKLLAIQDLDLKNEDVYGLENTPFRIFLRDNVDLLRDARIMAVEQSDTQIAVTVTDKSPDSPGQITIYLSASDQPELAGWVTTDVQGGVTKVEVSNIERPENLDANLFRREKLFMKSIQ
jgi:outer membrane lipoprotein-sorting protein